MRPMMERSTLSLVVAGGLLLAAPACAPWGGGLEGVGLPSSRVDYVYGEIRSVDTRRNVIQVRDNRGSRAVRYNGRTRVVYRNRQYPVSSLERGDRVQVRVAQARGRTPVAERIDVRESVRNRRVIAAPVASLTGTVGRLDTRRNYFTLERGRQNSLTIRVPRSIRREDARRFTRLRRGDRVRVEVRLLANNSAELIRFR